MGVLGDVGTGCAEPDKCPQCGLRLSGLSRSPQASDSSSSKTTGGRQLGSSHGWSLSHLITSR